MNSFAGQPESLKIQRKYKEISSTQSYSNFVKETLNCVQSQNLPKCLPNHIGKTTLEDFVEISNKLNGENEKRNEKIKAFADPIISKTVIKCLGNQPSGFQIVEDDHLKVVFDELACDFQKTKDGKWQLDKIIDIGD